MSLISKKPITDKQQLILCVSTKTAEISIPMHLHESYPNDYSINPAHIDNPDPPKPLQWDWEYEHADRKNEAKADAALHGSIPFQVDRKVLKDVVREKMGLDVARITFLSSGE